MSVNTEEFDLKRFYETHDFSEPMVLLIHGRGGMSLLGSYCAWWQMKDTKKKPVVDFDPNIFPKKGYDLASPFEKRKGKDWGSWNKSTKSKG